jgi:GntR family transcriptional regulator
MGTNCAHANPAAATTPRHQEKRGRLEHEIRRVRDSLRAALRQQHFPEGRLPTEDALMTDFSVSRAVIRGALTRLREEGLLARIRGVGTIGDVSVVSQPILEFHGAAAPTAGSPLAGNMDLRVLSWRDIRAPEILTMDLDAPPGAPILCMQYVGALGGEPLFTATNYVRHPEASRLRASMFRTDWYALLADADLDVFETMLSFETVLADGLDAPLLEVRVGSPVMFITNHVLNDRGEVFNVAHLRMRGDRLRVVSRACRLDSSPLARPVG